MIEPDSSSAHHIASDGGTELAPRETRVRVDKSDVRGGVAGRDINYNFATRKEPWRLTEIARAELERNKSIFVEDICSKGAFDVVPAEPLTLVRGKRRTGRYATALCCTRHLTEVRLGPEQGGNAVPKNTSARAPRAWRVDDLDCGLDIALQQVCHDNPGDIVIVRDAEDGLAAGPRHALRDVASTLHRIKDCAQAYRCSVILTVSDALEGAKSIAVPERIDLDKLMQIVGKHGREAVSRLRIDTQHEQFARATKRFSDWFRQVALQGKAVAPGRIAAAWDQFGAELLAFDDGALDADTDARLVRILSGDQAQAGWFTAQPFPDRVAMVLVWLFEGLESAALMESATAVLEHVARLLREDVLASRGAEGTSVRDVARRLIAPTHASPVRVNAGRVELVDPAIGDAIQERAADYAFLLAPLASALSETLLVDRRTAPAWREAFGRALGRIGVHRLDEFVQHVEALWKKNGPRERRIELREAMREACRGGPAAAGRVAAFLMESGRLDSAEAATLALEVLPALVNAHVAAREGLEAGEESDDANVALDLARNVAQASASLSQGEDVKRAMRRVLIGVARNAPVTVESSLRQVLPSCEDGDPPRDADFSRLLAEALGDALPALLPRRRKAIPALLADLLRCSNANPLARAALQRALPALAEHARPDERDNAHRGTGPSPSWRAYADVLLGLAWHMDTGVIRGLRWHLADVRERIVRAVGTTVSRDVPQRLAELARETDAAMGLVVRACGGRVVIAGRFHGQQAEEWRTRLQAWLAPYAEVVVADASDLDRVRAALAPAGGQLCALVYLALEADGDTDVLALSSTVLAIGPEAPTGVKSVERVCLDSNAPREARHRAFTAVLAWWSRHVELLVEAGEITEDTSARLREVVRLGSASDSPGIRGLVERLVRGTPEERVLARAALLRNFRRAAPPAGTADALAAQWRGVREALAELPQRHWDDLWLAAVHAGAPLHYVRPHGERSAAIVVKLADADGGDDNSARASLRRGPAHEVFGRLQRGLAERQFEVQTREEPPQRRTSRSLEHLLEPIRASECALLVLLGGRASLGESLIDIEDWRAWLGPRLVVVDVSASLARQRAQSVPLRKRIARQQQADDAASVVRDILGQIDRQLRPTRRVETERPVSGGA